MLKNLRLSAAMADVGWHALLTNVEYKLNRQGGRVVKIDLLLACARKYCSCCGAINEELKLSDRDWPCVGCRKIHDGDYNASQNLRTERVVILKAAGLSVSPHAGCVRPALIAQRPMKWEADVVRRRSRYHLSILRRGRFGRLAIFSQGSLWAKSWRWPVEL